MSLSDDGEWEPDPLIMDERFLAVNVRDKGLVVFSACSHAGVVNVLKHAAEVFPGVPLHAVMGGFHLAGPGMEQRIAETVRDMRDFELDLIVPGHCTGFRAVHALLNEFRRRHRGAVSGRSLPRVLTGRFWISPGVPWLVASPPTSRIGSLPRRSEQTRTAMRSRSPR